MNPSPRFGLVALLTLTGCVAPLEQDLAEPPADDPEPIAEGEPEIGSWIPEGYDPSEAERVIFLGDSITAGAGSSQGQLAYRPLLVDNVDSVWPEYSGRDLRTLMPELERVINVSRGGSTTSIVVRDQLQQMADAVGPRAKGPSAAFITIGGNDMQLALASFLAVGVEAAEERVELLVNNLDETIDALRDPGRFPAGTHVYMSNVYEPTDGEGMTEECFGGIDLFQMLEVLSEANDRIRALAQERGVAMIDLREHFRGHGFYAADPGAEAYDEADPTQWLGEDCIHPNDRGHHEVRRLFYAVAEGEPLEAD